MTLGGNCELKGKIFWFTLVHSVDSGLSIPTFQDTSLRSGVLRKDQCLGSLNPEAERARTIPGTCLELSPGASTLGSGEPLARPSDPDLRGIRHHNPVPVVTATYTGSRPCRPGIPNLLCVCEPWGSPSQNNGYKCIK